MDQFNNRGEDPRSRTRGGYSQDGQAYRQGRSEEDYDRRGQDAYGGRERAYSYAQQQQQQQQSQSGPDLILTDDYEIVRKRSRHGFMSFLLGIGSVITFMRNLVFNIIFLLLMLFVFGGYMAFSSFKDDINGYMTGNLQQYALPDTVNAEVLYFDLQGSISEQPLSAGGVSALQREIAMVLDGKITHEIGAIENALILSKTDPKLKKVLIDIDGMGEITLSMAERIGRAMDVAKGEGREVVVIGTDFSQAAYALASHADRIVMDPLGQIDLKGVAMVSLFFKDMLQKAGITPYVFRAGHFKSAVEPFILNGMSYDVKKEYEAIAYKSWAQYRSLLRKNRGGIKNSMVLPDAATYTGWLRRFDGDRASLQLAEGFVDEVTPLEKYLEGLTETVAADGDDPLKPAIITYKDYLMRHYVATSGTETAPDSLSNITVPNLKKLEAAGDAGKVSELLAKVTRHAGSDRVEVIYGIGEITDTASRPDDFAPDNIVPLLDNARLDDHVKAVVLYLNSPGGSVRASEKIRRAVEQLQSSGKKVVVSMNGTAASGAYWIACQADRIYATETTITGSIGVFGIGFGAHKLLNNFGAYQDGVATNELARAAIAKEMPDSQQQMLSMSVESTYKRFIKLVSEKRNLDPLAYPRYAEGQIFHADSAQELGLIDKTGSLQDAIEDAMADSGVKPELLRVRHVSPDSLNDITGFDTLLFGLSSRMLPMELTDALLELRGYSRVIRPQEGTKGVLAISPVSEPKF